MLSRLAHLLDRYVIGLGAWRLTAYSEETLPLSGQWGDTGPDNLPAR